MNLQSYKSTATKKSKLVYCEALKVLLQCTSFTPKGVGCVWTVYL